MFEHVEGFAIEEAAAGVALLTLQRPEKLNALTEDMMVALPEVAEWLSSESRWRALIIRGEGRGFCAGADLEVVQQRRVVSEWRWPAMMGREAELLAGCEIPTIAVVHGPAVGLGMGLALGCDMRVMEPAGYFAEGHLALGLAPTAMSWWLSRMCGLTLAAEIVMTGRRVGAEEALAIGLANRLVDEGQGVTSALELAKSVAAMPPAMSRMAKYVFWTAQDDGLMEIARRAGGSVNRLARAASRALGEPSASAGAPPDEGERR